jgi:CheY-like chemotaxis protein
LFPVLEGEAPEEDLAATDAAPGRGELVLFVDDEPSLAILGRRRLEALGYRVVAATDAAGALARLREAPERFDLVVTDYSMPRMSGLELAREIHAVRADLPIILLTGYMEEFPADDLAAAGVRAKAKKPISLSDLAAITRAVLETGT